MKKQIALIISLLLIAAATALSDNLGFEEGLESWNLNYSSGGQNYQSDTSLIWSSEGNLSLFFAAATNGILPNIGHRVTIVHSLLEIKKSDQVCLDVYKSNGMNAYRLESNTLGTFLSGMPSGTYNNTCKTAQVNGTLDLSIVGISDGCPGDCLGRIYLDNIRVYSCTDGILNNNETDVDCGGPFCDDCSLGDTCILDSDCESGLCSAGVCSSNETNANAQTETQGGGGGSARTITDYISIRKEDYANNEEVQKSIDRLRALYSGTLSEQQKKIYEQKLQALEEMLASFDNTALEEQTAEKEETSLELIRNELELADIVSNEEILDRLLEIKNDDLEHYEAIVDIAKDAPQEQREVLVEELIEMDADFIRELGTEDNAQEQIHNYAISIEQGVQDKESILNDKAISDIFSGERNLDDVLSLLNGLQ